MGNFSKESIRGWGDGDKGNLIPENTSLEYRDSYAKAARLNHETERGLTVCVFLNILAVGLMISSNLYSTSQRETLRIERENRICSFYQNYGTCPSNLTARGIDDRMALWEKEVGYVP